MTSLMAPPLHIPSDILLLSRQLGLDTKNVARPLLGKRGKANENALIPMPATMTPLNPRTAMPPQRSKVAMEVGVQVLGATRNRI